MSIQIIEVTYVRVITLRSYAKLPQVTVQDLLNTVPMDGCNFQSGLGASEEYVDFTLS